MEELVNVIIWSVIIYFVVRIGLSMLVDAIEKDQMREKIMEHADRIIRIVKLEPLPEHGTILAYDHENNQFLGQGSTEKEVKESIMKRFPEKVFLLNDQPFTANVKANIKISNAS